VTNPEQMGKKEVVFGLSGPQNPPNLLKLQVPKNPVCRCHLCNDC